MAIIVIRSRTHARDRAPGVVQLPEIEHKARGQRHCNSRSSNRKGNQRHQSQDFLRRKANARARRWDSDADNYCLFKQEDQDIILVEGRELGSSLTGINYVDDRKGQIRKRHDMERHQVAYPEGQDIN